MARLVLVAVLFAGCLPGCCWCRHHGRCCHYPTLEDPCQDPAR